MAGFMYRTGLRIFNLGVKLRVHWIMKLGYHIKRKGMEEYI